MPFLNLPQTAALLASLADLAALTPASASPPAGAAQNATVTIPTGKGHQVAKLNGTPIELFIYKPAGCRISAILLVFHGMSRDAGPYRDHATPLGQHFCMLVVAPRFDRARHAHGRNSPVIQLQTSHHRQPHYTSNPSPHHPDSSSRRRACEAEVIHLPASGIVIARSHLAIEAIHLSAGTPQKYK